MDSSRQTICRQGPSVDGTSSMELANCSREARFWGRVEGSDLQHGLFWRGISGGIRPRVRASGWKTTKVAVAVAVRENSSKTRE